MKPEESQSDSHHTGQRRTHNALQHLSTVIKPSRVYHQTSARVCVCVCASVCACGCVRCDCRNTHTHIRFIFPASSEEQHMITHSLLYIHHQTPEKHPEFLWSWRSAVQRELRMESRLICDLLMTMNTLNKHTLILLSSFYQFTNILSFSILFINVCCFQFRIFLLDICDILN